ncbi:hypothetical protein ACOMHN_054010 [Nucella lapillus]
MENTILIFLLGIVVSHVFYLHTEVYHLKYQVKDSEKLNNAMEQKLNNVLLRLQNAENTMRSISQNDADVMRAMREFERQIQEMSNRSPIWDTISTLFSSLFQRRQQLLT